LAASKKGHTPFILSESLQRPVSVFLDRGKPVSASGGGRHPWSGAADAASRHSLSVFPLEAGWVLVAADARRQAGHALSGGAGCQDGGGFLESGPEPGVAGAGAADLDREVLPGSFRTRRALRDDRAGGAQRGAAGAGCGLQVSGGGAEARAGSPVPDPGRGGLRLHLRADAVPVDDDHGQARARASSMRPTSTSSPIHATTTLATLWRCARMPTGSSTTACGP
jgi:hypothetical protein